LHIFFFFENLSSFVLFANRAAKVQLLFAMHLTISGKNGNTHDWILDMYIRLLNIPRLTGFQQFSFEIGEILL